MKWSRFATFAILGVLLFPAGLAGQWVPEVRVTPRAGLLTPPGWFYVEYAQFGVIPMEWTEAAILRAPTVGGALELAFDGAGVWVRGEVVRTLGAETAVIHAVLYPPTQAGPAQVVRTRFNVPTTITAGSLDLGFPTRLRIPGGVQPYVTAGVGGKRYGFDLTPFEGREENVIVPQGGTVPALNIGAGATVTAAGLTLDLLVRNSISEYWGEQQNDVMFLAGMRFRVR